MLQSEHVRLPRNVSREWHFCGMQRWEWCDRFSILYIFSRSNISCDMKGVCKVYDVYAGFRRWMWRLHTLRPTEKSSLVEDVEDRLMSSSRSRFVEWPFQPTFRLGRCLAPCPRLTWHFMCCLGLSCNSRFPIQVCWWFQWRERVALCTIEIYQKIWLRCCFWCEPWGPWLDWIYETVTC